MFASAVAGPTIIACSGFVRAAAAATRVLQKQQRRRTLTKRGIVRVRAHKRGRVEKRSRLQTSPPRGDSVVITSLSAPHYYYTRSERIQTFPLRRRRRLRPATGFYGSPVETVDGL